MPDHAFDRHGVIDALRALAALLAEQGEPHQSIVIVGGSYLAMLDLRKATRDIDTVTRIGPATRRAVAEVAAAQGLEAKWLNDASAAFRPAGLTAAHCTVLFEDDALTVLGPSPDWIFLMKLYAGRTIDHGDMIRLWPHCGFSSAEDAVQRYSDAYPHAPEDEHLVDYVRQIGETAGC